MSTTNKGTIIAACIGALATIISSSITFNVGRSNMEEKLYNDNQENHEIITQLQIKIKDLESEISSLQLSANKAEETISNYESLIENANKTINEYRQKLNIDTSEQDPIVVSANAKPVYVFDAEPYLVENYYLYSRNCDKNTVQSKDSWRYNDDSIGMVSTGVYYEKGMNIVPKSSEKTKIYYNLENKYNTLTGKIAFDDGDAERVDYSYLIKFYIDDELRETVQIFKAKTPIDFTVELKYGQILMISLEKPLGDNSKNAGINLIEFLLIT